MMGGSNLKCLNPNAFTPYPATACGGVAVGKHPTTRDRIQASKLSRAARIRSTGFFCCVACRMKTEVRAKGIDAGGCFDLQHSSIAFLKSLQLSQRNCRA